MGGRARFLPFEVDAYRVNQSNTEDSASRNTSAQPAALRSRTRGRLRLRGIDLHQRDDAQSGYIESMKIEVAQLS